jgi:outer membrane protein TolC
MKHSQSMFAGLIAVSVAWSVAGCTVGPDYAGPPKIVPPAADRFHNAGPATRGIGTVDARWWHSLNDPLLDRLVAQALVANPTVEQAEARLRESRSALNEKRADLLPSADTSALYLHAHTGGNILSGAGSSAGLFNATHTLSC